MGDKTRLILFLAVLLLLVGLVSSESENGQYYNGEVNASEILEKIKQGEPLVKYDHVIVKGDLDFRQQKGLNTTHIARTQEQLEYLGLSENQTQVNSSLTINDSEIEGVVYMNDTLFWKQINFEGSKFNGEDKDGASANFRGTTFNNGANFAGSSFNGDARFEDSKFDGDADFTFSKFNRNANFTNSAFKSPAKFWYSFFNGHANFILSKFNKNAYFAGSRFNRDARFNVSTFNDETYFSDSIFNGLADFIGSKFNKNAYFKSSRFNNKVDFTGSTFNGDAYFEGARFNNEAGFNESTFKNETYFDEANFAGVTHFYNSEFVGDALFQNATFSEPLDLTRAKYDKLYIKWTNIKKELRYDESAYQQLIENFKKLGYVSDVDKSYYEFRVEQFRHPDDPVRRSADLIAWVTYGFGKQPIFPLIWSIMFVLLFGFVWWEIDKGKSDWFGIDSMKPDEYEYSSIEYVPISDRRWRNLLETLIFSATVFLSGTRLFVDPPPVPALKGMSGSLTKKLFIVERILGGCFTFLFFLTLTGMILKT
ncbi:MAG: pentapeptide repeat-containing protein [Methanotrichaceae archaeon]|nr:pentapeptide repeat-containing protein [Methanotrichaceae archaeon]